jgi:hypothetical protein
MTEAWFSPEAARSLAFLALLAVVAGFEPLARRGRGRIVVTGVYGSCIVLGVVLMVAGGVAVWPASLLTSGALSLSQASWSACRSRSGSGKCSASTAKRS